MSRITANELSSLLADKGNGAASADSPSREINHETTNSRSPEKIPSSEFVNLGFKVPKEFRHRIRKIAADDDVSLVEVLREAIDLYEERKKIRDALAAYDKNKTQ